MPQLDPFENHNKDEEKLLTSSKAYIIMLETTIQRANHLLIQGAQVWAAMDVLQKAINEMKK